jgi:hypothetical protein
MHRGLRRLRQRTIERIDYDSKCREWNAECCGQTQNEVRFRVHCDRARLRVKLFFVVGSGATASTPASVS